MQSLPPSRPDGGTLHSLIDSGRGATRAEDAQGTPTQSHISPSILVYENEEKNPLALTPLEARLISRERHAEGHEVAISERVGCVGTLGRGGSPEHAYYQGRQGKISSNPEHVNMNLPPDSS